MSVNVNYEGQPVAIKKRVFYVGTDAIVAGRGLCYDRDYDDGSDDADAIDAWGKRDKCVNLPSQTNNNSFAGVACYSAVADAKGQWIDIYVPGSVTLVDVLDASVTIGDNAYVCCLAGGANAGKFSAATPCQIGKGVARVMQTLTAAGLCLVELMDGAESGLIEIIPTATLTAGGAITCMVGGTTFFDGAATPASDCTFTLANGTYIGQKKAFDLDGALTTNDVLVTCTAAASLSGATISAISTLEFDGDNDYALLEWSGRLWVLRDILGAAIA